MSNFQIPFDPVDGQKGRLKKISSAVQCLHLGDYFISTLFDQIKVICPLFTFSINKFLFYVEIETKRKVKHMLPQQLVFQA